MAKQHAYTRFTLAQRVEHIVLLISFTLLCLTGLPQKYAGTAIAEWMIQTLGGIEPVRTIHHASAIIFVMLSIYHALVLAYKIYVKRAEMSMLPRMGDVTDAIGVVRYNLGLAKERPRLPRYGFEEKAEYWAMLWGTAVMAATGFMLWNPIFVSRLLPGEAIPAAKVAHGGEAVLAALAIIVWHFYNVHVKMFNKSIFTGKLTHHQMAEEHGWELARLEAGTLRPAPAAAAVQRRRRTFFPVAIPLTLLIAGGLYWFATFENTAIATVPGPTAAVPVFAPLPSPTPSATPGAITGIGPAIPHDVAGKEQCDTCHGPNGVKPYPTDHLGRPIKSCQVCHKAGSTPEPGATGQAQGGPAAIPHPIEGRENCALCHAVGGGLQPMPADHTGRDNATCTACHQLSPAISGTPAAATTAGAAGGARPVPHSITDALYQDCTQCHGAGKVRPFPANHASFAVDTCTTCHKPTEAGTPAAGTTPSAGSPHAIPHPIDDPVHKDCLMCHAVGTMKPFPANHATFAIGTCTTCHTTGGNGATAAPGSATPPAAGATPAASTSTIKAIPHPIDDSVHKDCLMCHAAGTMKPFPANHAGYTVNTCTTCHKLAAQ